MNSTILSAIVIFIELAYVSVRLAIEDREQSIPLLLLVCTYALSLMSNLMSNNMKINILSTIIFLGAAVYAVIKLAMMDREVLVPLFTIVFVYVLFPVVVVAILGVFF